jgi:hypothetical protein
MADLDDGPGQSPIADAQVQKTVLDLLGEAEYDLIITHGPRGEYTRHIRHAEICNAVTALWTSGRIRSKRLWFFAYEDGNGAYLPHATEGADVLFTLPPAVWDEKYRIIHEVYGFPCDSWEARTTPRTEAFWRFESPEAIAGWLQSNRERP